MKKTLFLSGILFLLSVVLCGCSLFRIEEAERTPVEYTVVSPEKIPAEITALVEEKKEKEFQITFQSGKDMYLIKGYGRQMTGGYSIAVEELGMSENALFFKTRLIGPEEKNQTGEPSYPHIVVKTRYRKEPVKFL